MKWFLTILSLTFWGLKKSIAQQEIFPSDYSVSYLTPDMGLSQGSNYFRFEDSKGFMWLTGNDALNRFDGKNVKVYNLDKFFLNCPPLQQGYGIAEDGDANIYSGSVRGLYKYIRKKEKFILLNIFKNNSGGATMPFGYADGKIWCFNQQRQIASYNTADGEIKIAGQLPLDPIASVHIYDIIANVFYYRFPFIDKNKNAWFVTEHEILKLNLQNKFEPEIIITKDKGFTFYSATYDTANNRLIAGTNNSIVSISTLKNQVEQISKMPVLPPENINGIAVGKNGYFFTTGFQLLETDTNFKSITSIHIPQLKSSRIFLPAFDKAGRLWLCSDGEGQIIMNPHGYLFEKITETEIKDAGASFNGAISFGEFPDSTILINGIYLFNPKHKQAAQYPYTKLLGLGRTFTDTINKGIWYFTETASGANGEIYFIKKNQEPELIYSPKSGAVQGNIHDLYLFNHDILCAFSHGLYRMNLQTKSFERIAQQPEGDAFKISNLPKRQLFISYLNGNAWLAVMDNENNIHFKKEILSGVQSFYCIADEKNHYWIGTNNGVYETDTGFNVIKKIDANNGLSGTYIYGLLQDNDAHVWVSHQRGLSSIDINTGHIVNYGKEDGIQDWDFNNRAFYKSSDGTLYFGGGKGFNYFKPPFKNKIYYYPQIYIDDITANSIAYNSDTSANEISSIRLPYSGNNISLIAHVADLENGNSQKIFFRINKDEWKPLAENGLLTFNRLSSGNYKLEFAIQDKFTGVNTILKTLSISIDKPFYLTTWFWVLGTFLLSVLLFAIFYQWKITRQKRLLRQQNELMEQRKKITADLHDEIGSSLSSLQINSAVAGALIEKKNVQKAGEVIGKVETQSKRLSEKIGDIIWSMKPGADEFMSLSTRIKNYVSDILGATAIQYNIYVDEQTDKLAKDFILRKNILLIIKEAVNNAAKYSGATIIEISIKIIDKKFTILVQDNGVGLKENYKAGNGLLNMKKRTEELGGIFKMSSSEKGATVESVIPVPNIQYTKK